MTRGASEFASQALASKPATAVRNTLARSVMFLHPTTQPNRLPLQRSGTPGSSKHDGAMNNRLFPPPFGRKTTSGVRCSPHITSRNPCSCSAEWYTPSSLRRIFASPSSSIFPGSPRLHRRFSPAPSDPARTTSHPAPPVIRAPAIQDGRSRLAILRGRCSSSSSPSVAPVLPFPPRARRCHFCRLSLASVLSPHSC